MRTLRWILALGSTVLVGAGHAVADSWLDFDGTDDRVTVPYDPSFPTAVFSAAGWINTLPPSRRSAIIARGEDDTSWNLVWQLYVHPSGRFEIMLENASEQNQCYPFTCQGQPRGDCVTGDMFVADGEWHHVAATREASGVLVLYVDGDERATCQPTILPSSNNSQRLTKPIPSG